MMEQLESYEDFVLKPARGAMGNGIVVIVARDGDLVQKPGAAARFLLGDRLDLHGLGVTLRAPRIRLFGC